MSANTYCTNCLRPLKKGAACVCAGVKLTRQGVRDLDAVGPKPQRGHVGTAKEQHDEQRCAHFWEWVEAGGWTTPSFDTQKCALCGKWR